MSSREEYSAELSTCELDPESLTRELWDPMLSENDASSSGESEHVFNESLEYHVFVELRAWMEVYVGLLLCLQVFLHLFTFGMAAQQRVRRYPYTSGQS